MQILLNDKNEITNYAIVGGFENGIVIDNIPSDFVISFKPYLYSYIEGNIVLNENYEVIDEEQPTQPPIIEMPSSDEELRKMFADMQVQIVQANTMCNQVSQQNANLSQEVVKLNKEIENLKGANDNENVIS